MIDDDVPWRLAVVDSLLRLMPPGPPAAADVLELGTYGDGGSALDLARTYDSCVSLNTSSRVTAAARKAAPSDVRVTYRRRYPLLAGSPDDAPFGLVVGWHFERRFLRALLRQAPHGLIVSPIFLDHPRSGMAFAIIRVRTLAALLTLPRPGDPPTQWNTFPSNVVQHPDAVGVTCGCPTCDLPDPLGAPDRPTLLEPARCLTATPPMLTLVA